MNFDFKVVIPARYGSTRLPAKPLKKIAGKPMIQWVYENALRAEAGEVIAAVDDERIVDAVESFGGRVMMTSQQHQTGTDRIAEVAERLGWSEDTIVVNLQGDEPTVDASLIAQVARALNTHSDAAISTLATPITAGSDLFNPNVVKVVRDVREMALYFSRAPIPWVRDEFVAGEEPPVTVPSGTQFLRHLGLYAYRVDALLKISKASPSELERVESLEQLRAMSLGLGIHVSVIDEAPGHGVDTAADLERVEKLLKR